MEPSYQALKTEGLRPRGGGDHSDGEGESSWESCSASRSCAAAWLRPARCRRPLRQQGLTFVPGGELAHLGWEGLVELVLPWDQGLAQGCLIEAEHARVPPDLVDKGLQQDALGVGLHVHGPESWAHPPGAAGREEGKVEGSGGQRVVAVGLRVPPGGLVFLAVWARTLCRKQTVTWGLEAAWEPL